TRELSRDRFGSYGTAAVAGVTSLSEADDWRAASALEAVATAATADAKGFRTPACMGHDDVHGGRRPKNRKERNPRGPNEPSAKGGGGCGKPAVAAREVTE